MRSQILQRDLKRVGVSLETRTGTRLAVLTIAVTMLTSSLTMDVGLKQHFDEFRAFVVETVGGAEQRLTARIAGVEVKVDNLASTIDVVGKNVELLLNRAPSKRRASRER